MSFKLFFSIRTKLYIGPEASGFNTLLNDNFENFEIPNEIVIAGFFKYNDKIFVSTAVNTYYLENGQLNLFASLYTNGARIYHDNDHLWAIVNTGAGNGNVSLLNLVTKEKLKTSSLTRNTIFMMFVRYLVRMLFSLELGKPST